MTYELQLLGRYKQPFFGKVKKLLETIHSLDEKWYVEFWEVHYYFFGIEVYTSKKEVVRSVNGTKSNQKVV